MDSDKEEKRDSPIWMTVYADFSTNLMFFFLILFAFTRTTEFEQKKIYKKIKNSISSTEQKNAILIEKKAEKKIEDIIKKQNTENFALITIDENIIKIVLREAIAFSSGESELSEKCFPVLNEIIEILKDIPNPIIIEGHTDDVPLINNKKFASNWELSGSRGISVLNYFVKKGINRSRISVVGYAENRPLFSNETISGRALNRRVEINIVRSY